MTEFEALLEECLEALRQGRRDIDECLRMYPQHADELRPHLLLAARLTAAYDVEPRAEFARDARERFLVASGKRLEEAFDADPSPSFFAAARVRFLMAAQRMNLRERAGQSVRGSRRQMPVFGTPFRALASLGVTTALFLSFSTYTVASANSSVPGDWQYPVKLQTERVRLALAFSDDAKRDVRLDIAGERAEEIEELAERGRIIGPGVLERLADSTEPLVEAAEEGKLDSGELDRLRDVSNKQRETLALAEDQVAPDAKEQFAVAVALAKDGEVAAVAKKPGPVVLEPGVAATTPDPDETPEATPDDTATADPETTPSTGSPTAVPPTATATPARASLAVDQTPVDQASGVLWVRLVVGRLTTLIPSEKDGWRITGLNLRDEPVSAPTLVRLSNLDGTSLITINPRNGDMFWFVSVNGTFDEVQMRITRDGQTRVQDREALQRLYGAAADIPLYMLDNIELAPPPTPVPTPSSTPPPTSVAP